MQYKDRDKISQKLYNNLEPIAKLDRVRFVADVGKFKNMELLNLYWGDANRMDGVAQLMIDIACGHVDITVSTEHLDLQNLEMERDYWHTVAAGGDESGFPRKVKFQDSYWWRFSFAHYNDASVWGVADYDNSVGPGHKGGFTHRPDDLVVREQGLHHGTGQWSIDGCRKQACSRHQCRQGMRTAHS